MRNLYIQQLDVIGIRNLFLMQWEMSGDISAIATEESLEELTERLRKLDEGNVQVVKGTPVLVTLYSKVGGLV